MFPSYSKVVYLEGIRVPVSGVSASWGTNGGIQFNVSLLPSYEAEFILPSTQVHVFHVEAGKLGTKRTTYEADPNRVGLLPFNQKYMETDFLAEAAEKTIGSHVDPLTNAPNQIQIGDDGLIERMEDFGLIFLCAGVVDTVSSLGTARQGHAVELSCRGFDVDLELTQLIQLTSGRGTLTDVEKRFFGQDIKRQGKPKTVLHGKKRTSFADALAKLLTKDKSYAAGIRSLMAQYPALINDMWLHRYSWNRLANQIGIIEEDYSAQRLIGTTTFQKFVRSKIQGSYVVPLRDAMQTLLDFVGYRMISVPAPAYWPIVPAPKPRENYETKTTERKVKTGPYAIVKWGKHVLFDTGSMPVGAGQVEKRGEKYVYIDENKQVVELDTTVYGAGQTTGQLTEGNTVVTCTLPKQNNAGLPVFAGGQKFIIASGSARFAGGGGGLITVPRADVFKVGYKYRAVSRTDFAPTGEHPKRPLILLVTIMPGGGERTIRKTERIRKDLPPIRPARYYSNIFCRLNTYVLLPKLWWAAPPQCNIIVPEMIERITMNKPGLNSITRTIGRGQPGKGPGAKTRIEKFTAPNVSDLNAALEDSHDDPINAVNLLKTEYIAGVRAQVLPFGHLSKMAAASQWEDYMRSWVVNNHWDTRLEPRTAQVIVRTAVGIVPGAPCLVIRGTGEGFTATLSPEQSVRVGMLRQLRNLRSRLASARAGLLAHLRRMREMSRWVRNLKSLSTQLYDNNVIDAVDPEKLDGAYTKDGSTATQVNVGKTFVKLLQEGTIARRKERSAERQPLTAGAVSTPLASAADLGFGMLQGDIQSDRYRQTFDAVLKGDGAKIHPGEGGVIQKLPTTKELEGYEKTITDRSGGYGSCVQALDYDIKFLDAEIEKLVEELRRLGKANQQGRSFVGYVTGIQATSSSQQNTEQWVLSLSHVRHVGEDLDYDGLAGDDVENTVIFGEDGYLDERYHSENIGKKVYLPMFGSESIVDLESVKQAFDDYLSEPTADEQGRIDGILAELKHPGVCGKNYATEKAEGLLATSPPISFACQQIINEYFNLKSGGTTSEGVFKWIEKYHTRPWGTQPDMFRGFPLGFDRNLETSNIMPVSDYEPWQSDDSIYGFGLREVTLREFDVASGAVEEGPETFANNPPEGFFRTSIVPPYVTQLSDSNKETNNADATLKAAVQEYLSYGDKIDDNELALLKDRQRRILAYLENLADKTSSRRG